MVGAPRPQDSSQVASHSCGALAALLAHWGLRFVS